MIRLKDGERLLVERAAALTLETASAWARRQIVWSAERELGALDERIAERPIKKRPKNKRKETR
jgi:hypothetical protein